MLITPAARLCAGHSPNRADCGLWSYPVEQEENEHDHQYDSQYTHSMMTVAVPVSSTATVKTSRQYDDYDDEQDKSE